jgi:phenylalanyl-tRNA synthetase beta chain
MRIAYSWLNNYLPETIPVDQLSEILTNIGLEVEGIDKVESVKGSLEGLIIGEVLSCERHPNADKLSITTVNIGGEAILPIVCGAPNVAAGQRVVVATVGTTVYPTSGESFVIKKAKIRGEVSEGMICAEDEIGLGNSHAGIMVLPEDAPIGMPAAQYFKIAPAELVIEIGLTPNRSDAMSHIGVARDVCAYMQAHTGDRNKWQIKMPVIEEVSHSHQLPITVNVVAAEACPRYCGVSIKGVQIAPSPEWLQLKLKSIGLRPINNVVDITNYVLHEYGQPLHAFDYDKINNATIEVKHLPEGTLFTTLDDRERKLRAEDLMICDSQHGMCIAGVIGGTQSGVSNNTTNIFLESAWFNPRSIRRTSLYHGLRTDAATHFEKSVDIALVVPALKRAAALILEIAGGVIASDFIDIYPQPLPERCVTFTYEYINRICGKEYEPTSILTILTAQGFTIKSQTETTVEVGVPTNKADVHQPADIAEEVLRIHGLNNIDIPARLNISLQRRQPPTARRWKEKIASYLAGAGLQEIVTNSITNSKYYPNHTQLVRMINSLSSELDVMRPQMLESGLEVIAYNANRKLQDLRLFEFGNIYTQLAIGKYEQKSKLAIWLSGNLNQPHWQQQGKKVDIYLAKGIVSSLLQLCGIKKFQEQVQDQRIDWKRGKDVLATVLMVDAERLKAFDIRQEVYYIEIDVETWVSAAEGAQIKYQELPKFPAMKRDLAVVLDKSIPYAKVAAIAQSQKWDALRNYELFDVFENEKIGADKKSLALSFTFQLHDRTLTDEEVDGMMKTLIAAYQKDLNATIRE